MPDDLDRLIDGALASYADPGPDSGLERRLLARIKTTSLQRRRRLIWAAGLPALATAGLMLLVVANTSRHTRLGSQQEIGSQIESSRTSRSGTLNPLFPRATVRSSSHARRSARSTAPIATIPPKRDTFPSPTPLSNEERALVTLVAQTPAAQRQDLAVWLQPAEPIHIAAVSIPLINPPAEGKE
jgi:hypothetical protein